MFAVLGSDGSPAPLCCDSPPGCLPCLLLPLSPLFGLGSDGSPAPLCCDPPPGCLTSSLPLLDAGRTCYHVLFCASCAGISMRARALAPAAAAVCYPVVAGAWLNCWCLVVLFIERQLCIWSRARAEAVQVQLVVAVSAPARSPLGCARHYLWRPSNPSASRCSPPGRMVLCS
jgi:hypothetical protein